MNELIKASIDGRKQAFFNAYEINSPEIQGKIEDLFLRIEELGSQCVDNMDFEVKLASSPLNQEYIDLFTTIATTCPAKNISSEPNEVKSDAEYLADEVASDVKYVADDLTMPMRRQAREKAESEARNMPVIGDIMTAKQHYDLFSKFKKKKDQDNE